MSLLKNLVVTYVKLMIKLIIKIDRYRGCDISVCEIVKLKGFDPCLGKPLQSIVYPRILRERTGTLGNVWERPRKT